MPLNSHISDDQASRFRKRLWIGSRIMFCIEEHAHMSTKRINMIGRLRLCMSGGGSCDGM